MSSRFGVIGGYETAATVLIIIFLSLSAWGAFLIYRAFKGQRREKRSENNIKATEKEATRRRREDEDEWRKSTGSDDGSSEDYDVDSRETIILSHANHTKAPLEHVEQIIRETSHENVKEPMIEPLTGSSLGAATIGKEDHVICRHEVCDAAESSSVQLDLFDYKNNSSPPSEDQTENCVHEYICDSEESEIEQHVDVDEASETESAQEILGAKNRPVQKCQSVEDLLDNTLLPQEIMNKPNEGEIITETVLPVMHKTNVEDLEVTSSELESNMPLINDFDPYCYDEHSETLNNLASEKVKPKINVKSRHNFRANLSLQTKVGNTDDSLAIQQHLSKTLDHIFSNPPQNYLGFMVPGLQGDSSAPVQLSEQSKEKMQPIKADLSQKKNEISIMESIMDSNEWLSTGPPDARDLLWLTPTPSKTGYEFKANISSSPVSVPTSFALLPEEVMSHEEKTDMLEDTTTAVAKDEMDLLKKVGTVLPMPQLVQVNFRVHYITHSPKQTLAVTGNQQELGSWETFVPLRSVENGFWFCTVSLPLDRQVEWKFILVEEGQIQRWEECENRYFTVTGQEEEIHLNKNWGYA